MPFLTSLHSSGVETVASGSRPQTVRNNHCSQGRVLEVISEDFAGFFGVLKLGNHNVAFLSYFLRRFDAQKLLSPQKSALEQLEL